MATKFNSKKYYKTITTLIALSAAFLICFGLVFGVSSTAVYVSTFIVVVLALLYAYVISGNLLKRNFGKLGRTSGKTDTEIFAVVGKPDQTYMLDDGTVMEEWSMTTYNVRLSFRDGVCQTECFE